MPFELKEIGKYKYIEEGSGPNLVLLHGLFGALSNWDSVIDRFKDKFRIIIPMLPIYDMPFRKVGLDALVDHLEGFIDLKKIDNINLMGNSLGGHVALIYTLRRQETVKKLVLTGSSGLFENAMGGSFPKRGSYEYVKERAEYTFYNPKSISEEYVQEIFETTKSIPKCLNIVAIAKSAQRHNMANEIPDIKVPTLLIWGLNDTITPPLVAHDFNRLIPNTTLKFIDKCCHAPMMEQPEKFNDIMSDFLINENVLA
ncbi:MAG: alpha/beta hydrolase [Cyclobacteriaceae bacterium]|nr:alpha/beta hydrolase [Cyclobacteriaceae bacterium]MCK5468262.1 alpha/beta hydrolase [Cyclobacteriaceae bacterium]